MSTSRSTEPARIFDSAVRPDPYPLYAALREHARVTRDAGSGIWYLFGYEECALALRETERFSADRSAPDPAQPLVPARGRSMLRSDPPDHTRIRSTVARAFTPRAIAALEPRIRDIAEQLLADLAPGRPFEVVGGLAVPLPVRIIAELLGVASEDWPRFRRWSEGVISVAAARRVSAAGEVEDPDAREIGIRSSRELRAYFARVVEERRREPRDDLVSRMVAANEDGVLSQDELMNACVLLLLAGNETTTNLISNMALALARHPDQRRRLVEDPALLGTAVEEVMRFDGPVQFTSRRTTEDAGLGGRTIPAESFVQIVLAAANRDPERFNDPDMLDAGREDASAHLGFGRGIHYCLGAPQARLEAQIAFELLLRRAPDFELLDPGRTLAYGPNASLRGLRELWIVPR
jgi:cytochrome P450